MKIASTVTLVLCFILCGATRAATLTYVDQGKLNGSLGSISFTDTLVNITLTGSTGDVVSTSPGIYMLAGTSVFSIDGIGSGTFTSEIGVLADQLKGTTGFADFTGSEIVLGTISRLFRTYDLSSAIPPTLGLPATSGFTDTTAGVLFLSYQFGLSSFSATPRDLPVPEPATASCTAIALTALGLFALATAASGSSDGELRRRDSCHLPRAAAFAVSIGVGGIGAPS